MSEYLVETYVSSSEPHPVPDRSEIAAAAATVTKEGRPVRLLSAVRVPDEETCFYLFEASSPAAVVETAERCGLRFERVVPATSLTTQ